MVDGHRRPVVITVDDSMLILNERESVAPDEGIHASTTRGPGGNTIVNAVSPNEQRVLSFFTPSFKCKSAECQKLKDDYDKQAADARAKNCKSCEMGTIIRKFAPRIRAMLETGVEDE